MIVKPQDDEQSELAALGRIAGTQANPLHRGGALSQAERLRAGSMSQLMALHLDRQFGAAPDWAVLHGLRVPVGSHALRVDHLLINDFLECLCIDSRYLTRRLVPMPEGGFRLRVPSDAPPGVRVGSPLGKAAREARLMASVVDQRRQPRGLAAGLWAGRLPGPLPGRLTRRLQGRAASRMALRPRISVRSLVLHDPARSTSEADRDPLAGVALLAGTEALHELLQDQRQRRHRQPFARVPPTRLYALARALAAQHRSLDAWPDDDAAAAPDTLPGSMPARSASGARAPVRVAF